MPAGESITFADSGTSTELTFTDSDNNALIDGSELTTTVSHTVAGTAATTLALNYDLKTAAQHGIDDDRFTGGTASIAVGAPDNPLALSVNINDRSEGQSVTVTVTADNNLTADTTIPLALAASGTGTAAAAAADITGGFTGKSVTINENSATGMVDVAIVDDTIVEIDETFTIDLGTLPAGFARKDGDTAETITIQDFDKATLTVTISDNPTQNAEVTVTGALNNSIHIGAGNTLTFSSASATGNPDLVFTADTNGLVSGMTTGTHTPTEAGSRTYTYGLASAQHGIQTNRVSSTPATVTIAAAAVVRTGPAVIIPLDTGGEEGTRVTMILQADRPVTDGFTGTYT
ncbi:MAG: hypothetical protein MPJ82_06880, partial [Alphaproteobacteria bacterium]|nr:hypothetical protein [Alphaproteobacteria bacterium]